MYSNIGLNLTRSNIVLRYAFLILISIIFFFINPNVLILCLCVLFEYFINRIKINFKFSFNSEFVGLILLSYYTEPIYAIIFLFLTIVLRLVMGRFVLNYIWKQPIFILFAYIIPNLRMLSLIQVGIIFNVIRYGINLLINLFVTKKNNFILIKDMLQYMILSTIVFSIINSFLVGIIRWF